MKTIEEIEQMSLESLEAIADDNSVKAPAGMKARLEAALVAESSIKEKKARRVKWYAACGTLATAAAGAAIVLSVNASQPKDTFTDPLLAYAELEKTFSYISSKVDMGVSIVEDAAPAIEMPSHIIDKINNNE